MSAGRRCTDKSMLKVIMRRVALLLVLGSVAGTAAAQSVTGEVMDAAVRTELQALPADADYGAFVHFRSGTAEEQNALLAQFGLTVVSDFRRYTNAVFVSGPAAGFFRAAEHPAVSYVEHNAPLHYMGETQSWATHVRVAQEPVAGGPYYTDETRTQIIDGTGVALGIIDSGVMGAHPDFADNLLYNFKLVNPTSITETGPGYVEIGHQDSESQVGGHGTHVTGTVGGRGIASDGGYPVPEFAPNIPGTYTGAAPGADLIHWGNGAGLLVLDTAAAYRDMLERIDAKQDGFERLVAVNNSYGQDPGPYNPNSVASQLIHQIIDRGVVMAFAAGNDGGDGSTATTSPTCRDPYPGVICVASYNDRGTGDRNAQLSSFSSRGQRTDATTESFPDISAPGDLITSTCLQGLPSQAICATGAETDWQPYYGTISGTSMATPHVVGIIGLMQQAYIAKHGVRMTPAQVEELMQRFAIRLGDISEYVPDPQARDEFAALGGQTTTHFGYGAGLIDLPSMLDAIGTVKAGLLPAGEEFVVFDSDNDGGSSFDVVRLTMQEATVNGSRGIVHRLTLGSVDEVFAGTVYSIERNVNGQAFVTQFVGNAQGGFDAAPAGEENTAPASQISVDGSVVSVFVRYQDMGFPPANEPIHNIRVRVFDDIGPLDFAPSPAGGIDAAADQFRSMFGRAAPSRCSWWQTVNASRSTRPRRVPRRA